MNEPTPPRIPKDLIGGYYDFGTFRGSKADSYQPRYERTGERGQWRLTIQDEPEWLARPDLWGVEAFPEPQRSHKANWARHYSLSWFGKRFITCGTCSALLRLMIAESGFHPERLSSETVPENCDCGRGGIRHQCGHYLRGVITSQELFNKMIDILAGLKDSALRTLANTVGTAVYQEFCAEAARYGRWLSLELIGSNPFRPVSFNPNWRTSTVVAIAKTTYDSRDFSPMPILADALEDAGCDHADILAHCRGDGPHVRGCWVVDLVLGKQ